MFKHPVAFTYISHTIYTVTCATYAIVCWTVYRAVAWQRVDQICYIL
jgi:hypothetical protein